MDKYSLEELSTHVEKNEKIVEQWFEELEQNVGHYVLCEEGQKYFDQNDLEIAAYIVKKREEKWSFEDIFNKISEHFTLRLKKNSIRNDALEKDNSHNPEQDPENLFYQIAQDNEIIQMFKYHSLRVMFLSSSLAKRVEMYDENLRIAALLHDIGKMGLSINILLKREKLSELEFTIIQSHSHVGNSIVRKHLGLTKAAKYIRDHHERWDGAGYPRRLAGDEISVQGRIISICDAFDTMTIDQRNYKNNTLSNEEAFEELHRCSWTQFDGSLVEVFIDMMGEVTIPEYMVEAL